MNRNMMTLGRAKKKLRYFQSEESTPYALKIKDVFRIPDFDKIFDDLDSDPGTPMFSPLPRSPESEREHEGQSQVQGGDQASSHFRVDTGPLEGLAVLAADADVQMDHLNEGSPFEEIAPIKTSSPIELLAVKDTGEDLKSTMTYPLLFKVDDDKSVVVNPNKPQLSPGPSSASFKDAPQGDSDSLSPPPTRLNFVKPSKWNNTVRRTTPHRAPEGSEEWCKISAPESKEELQKNKSRSLSPVILLQRLQPEPVRRKTPHKQVQEVAIDAEVKQSFQKKLRNALHPKASGKQKRARLAHQKEQEEKAQRRAKKKERRAKLLSLAKNIELKNFRKQEPQNQPTRAPSPHVHEEDFMILDDFSPIRFTIPRKHKTKEKPAPESRSVEPDSKVNACPELVEEPEKHRNEAKKKTKERQRKASHEITKNPVLQSAPEERQDEDMGGGENIRLSPHHEQDVDVSVTGKQRPKGKTSKPEQYEGQDGNRGVGRIPAGKPTAKIKKTVRRPGDIITGQDEAGSNVKKKPKLKSTQKAGAPESTGVEDQCVVNNKKQVKQRQQVADGQIPEPPADPNEKPEIRYMNTANTESAPDQPKKLKNMEKREKIIEIKNLPLPESAASTVSKRKRMPPGEWWLTQRDEVSRQMKQDAVQLPNELKSNRKTPILTVSTEEELAPDSQEIQCDLVQELPRKLKKSRAKKTQPKSIKMTKSGTISKPMSAAEEQRESTPDHQLEKEARDGEALGELGPLACSSPSKRLSVTSGDKRMFDKSYTRESQRSSGKKCPPPQPDVPPESIADKRMRKVQQSEEVVESTRYLQTTSPHPSRTQMHSPQNSLHKMASLQKSVGHGWNKTKKKLVNTPKSIKRSLATFNVVYDSAKAGPSSERGKRTWQKGRRNLLHSLEEQSEQSSENLHSDYQQQSSSGATFDVCVNEVISESSAPSQKSNPRGSSGSKRASNYDALKSGPSSLIERYKEHEDNELPPCTIISQTPFTPRVLSNCDLCGPPLTPIVLDKEDWDNLCIWFAHMWPNISKDSKSISPDDFHWFCHAGRAMGHMVDLQNNTFSSGKILLGSYMKKPVQIDLDAITVFNVASSCVRVEIDSVKAVYNSGQTFMTPCGQSYSIHNLCQEPAVLWYIRMLPNHLTK